MAFSRGLNELMISRCFGEVVFPRITIIAIAIFGISVYLNLQNDNTAKTINAISRNMAFATNLGFPILMPITPITLIETKIRIIVFCCRCTMFGIY